MLGVPCGFPETVYVQITRFERMPLDELAAGLDLLAHQNAEHVVGRRGVFHGYLQERAILGMSVVSRRAPRRPFHRGL